MYILFGRKWQYLKPQHISIINTINTLRQNKIIMNVKRKDNIKENQHRQLEEETHTKVKITIVNRHSL